MKNGDLHHFVRDKDFKFVLLHHVRVRAMALLCTGIQPLTLETRFSFMIS